MNTNRGPCCTSGCTSVTTLGARIWATFSLWLWMRLHWEMKGSVAECRAGSAWCPNASSVCWGQLTQQHEYFISSSYTDQLELARQTLSCLCDFRWSHMSLLSLPVSFVFQLLLQLSLLLSCRDIAPPGEPLNKNSRPKVASRFPKLSRGHPREMRNVEPQSGDL